MVRNFGQVHSPHLIAPKVTGPIHCPAIRSLFSLPVRVGPKKYGPKFSGPDQLWTVRIHGNNLGKRKTKVGKKFRKYFLSKRRN